MTFLLFYLFVVYSKILSCGAYLPQKILTNKDLEKTIDTTDEWILQRTGITQRHIAADGELTSDLAFEAVKNCLKNYTKEFGKVIDSVDCILVATTTPDKTFPSTACILQSKLKDLGVASSFAFDVQAVCAGFVYGLTIADSMIKSSLCKSVIVIGADKLSSILNWQDRTTCVLFGDGAGAVLLLAQEGNETQKDGIFHCKIDSEGEHNDILKTSGGVGKTGNAGYIEMDGKEVFKHAVTKMSDSIKQIASHCRLHPDEIDFVIAHQANERILDAVSKKLEMTKTHFVKTVGIHANTSSASIPLALNHCLQKQLVKRGDKIIFEALGAGLTFGGVYAIW